MEIILILIIVLNVIVIFMLIHLVSDDDLPVKEE